MAIKLGDALLKIGVDKKDFNRDMKGLSGAINKHKKAIGIAMVGMGVAAIGAAAASVKAFADMGDEVQKMALRTSFSTEALSELRHAAELSGADLTTLEKGVKKMSKTIVDADEGMATYIRSFDRIGLSVEELMALSPEEQFIKITEAIAAVEDPTIRAATAQDIFGRAGTQLLPLMAAGADGLKEMREEAHKLGIVFDQEAANAAAEFKDNLTRLEGAISGVKFTLARELMPAMEAGIPLLTEWAQALGPIIENTLNWHAAYDKQVKTAKAWEDMMLQRQRFLGGLNHELGASLTLLESNLRANGELTDQNIKTIKALRAEITARENLTEAVDDGTEAKEEQLALDKEIEDQYQSSVDMLQDLVKEMEYERSEAGKLNISLDDVLKTLLDLEYSYDEIISRTKKLGDNSENVLAIMDEFGLTVAEVATAMGMEIEAVEKLIEKTKELGDATEKAGEKAISAQQNFDEFFRGQGKAPGYEQAFLDAWNERYGIDPGANVREAIAGGRDPADFGFATGGIAMRPMLTTVAERGPEAVIPLDKIGMIGGVTVTGNSFYVRNEADISKIANAIVSKVRQKTGVKV